MAEPLAAPLLFAQRLAANERGTRQQAVRRLRKYLRARSRGPSGGFSEDEFTKIWKGLFYCMWMQDKPLLQEDLANTISQLLHALLNTEAQLLFLQMFWQTMNREWNGIDRLRLDKYYTLSRMLLRESFHLLKKNNWEDSLVEPFLGLLVREVLHTESQAPNGVKFHLIDIYLEELAKVGSEELQAEQNLKLIDPFCKIAAKTKDSHLMHAIAQGVFEAIVDQAPFAIEELMKELKQSKDTSGEEEAGEESEEEEQKTARGKTNPRKRVQAESDEDLFDEEEDGGQDENEPIESIGPVLQFDYSAVADRLFQLSSKQYTPIQNRKRLYRLVQRFRDLAEGKFPQDDYPEDVSTDEDDDEFSQQWSRKKHFKALKMKAQENKAKEKAAEEADASLVPPKKKKRRRKRKAKDAALASVVSGEESPVAASEPKEAGTAGELAALVETRTRSADTELHSTGENPLTNENKNSKSLSDSQGTKVRGKRKKVCCPQESTKMQLQNGLGASDGPEAAFEFTSTRPNKKRKSCQLDGSVSLQQADESLVQATQDEGVTATSRAKKVKRTPVNGRSRTLSEACSTQGTGEGDVTCTTNVPKKKGRCLDVNSNTLLPPAAVECSKEEASDVAGSGLSRPKKLKLKAKKRKLLERMAAALAGTPPRNRKLKVMQSVAEVNGCPVLSSKKSKRSIQEADTFVPLVKNQLKKITKVDDFVKFGKVTLPKPVFVKKSKSGISGVMPKKQFTRLLDSGSKKVTFGLSKNMTAEFKKTDKSILVSPSGAPRIAFNPEQRPLHGVLKTPPMRTPLGALRKKKIKMPAALLCSPSVKQVAPVSTPSKKKGAAFSPLVLKQATTFSTPTQKQTKRLSMSSQKPASASSTPAQKHTKAVSTSPQKRATVLFTPPQNRASW